MKLTFSGAAARKAAGPAAGANDADPAARPARRDAAVIDIGSNSVRLVHFQIEDRAVWPVFNEKVMAGLGRGLRATGRLNPDGVETARRALKRFAELLDAKGVDERMAVATAAVREAEDGPDFVAETERLTGLRVQVLDGPEEGRLSALGVLGGQGEASGLAGDLGGSSLELTPLSGRSAGTAVSLPLGPLSMLSGEPDEARRLKDAIDAELDRAEAVLAETGPTFYAVGGAWRAFARIAMALEDHPLSVLHQYALTREEAFKAADFAVAQSESSIAAVPGVSAKRAAAVPYAAQLLRRILRRGDFREVVFSAYGLREGVVFARHPELIETGDPLIAGAEALARLAGEERAFGRTLSEWIEPAFAGEPAVFGEVRDAVLRRAAGALADLGARMHPDHRAGLCAEQTLYAPFGGVTHAERAFLALAVHHRYAGKKSRPEGCPSRRLLSEEQREAALRLGLALRLGAALSGRSAALLSAFSLVRGEGTLTLAMTPGREALVVERALQRFEQLAAALGLEPRAG